MHRRRRRPQYNPNDHLRKFSHASKIGVALPTPPGGLQTAPPCPLDEYQYNMIPMQDLNDLQYVDEPPYSSGTFQRGLSAKGSRKNHQEEPYSVSNKTKQDLSVPNADDKDEKALSITYDTIIAENECYR